MKPILTIAIPTYNRPKQLGETLRRLLSQADPRWVLQIHDNCSELPAEEVNAELLEQIRQTTKVTVFRNKANVGGNANILRCFEDCTTEWLVVLSDDDEIEPDYIEAFLDVIAANPQIIHANFSSTLHIRKQEFRTRGFTDFCHNLDSWSNLLFIPCGVYKVEAITPYLPYGYTFSFALAPHMAMLLQSLKERQGECLFLTKCIVKNVQSPEITTWNRMNINLMGLLVELIPDRDNQQAFLRKVLVHANAPTRLASSLIEKAYVTSQDVRLHFELRILYFLGLTSPWRHYILFPLLRFLVAHPQWSAPLFRFLRRLRGYDPHKKVAMDLYQGL